MSLSTFPRPFLRTQRIQRGSHGIIATMTIGKTIGETVTQDEKGIGGSHRAASTTTTLPMLKMMATATPIAYSSITVGIARKVAESKIIETQHLMVNIFSE